MSYGSLTKAEQETITDYLYEVAEMIGLGDWDLRFQGGPPKNDSAWAAISAAPGRRCAYVWLCKGFRQLDPCDQRETVLHELLHLHFDEADCVIERDLVASGALRKRERKMLVSMFRRQMEFGIDAVAVAFAETVPLIEWP